MSETAIAPKLFVSYSHDNPQHKDWVLTLATRLVNNGVDVILDQWNLALGSNIHRFMSSNLTSADRILAICTHQYVRKADDGLGGVGFESMILTAQIAGDLSTDRIIPILRDNASGSVPTFLCSRVYADFRDDLSYEEQYGVLLREIHRARVLVRPTLGKNPFAGPAAENPYSLSFSNERYISPTIEGQVTFNYSNNDGSYTVGSGDMLFKTHWSRAGSTSIYAYRDGTNCTLALAAGISSFDDLGNVARFDSSSRVRNPTAGQIVIWRNNNGYYLATKIEKIHLPSSQNHEETLTFSYRVQTDRSSIFGNKDDGSHD